METRLYLPDLSGAQFVRQYVFQHPQHGPCNCVLVTHCKANSPRLKYAHVMYVYEHGDFLIGKPCFAVAAEVNRLAGPGSGRSYFLGVFPGVPLHANLGASDEWADIDKFTSRALEVIAEYFSLAEAPEEIPVPTLMLKRFRVPPVYGAGENMAQTKAKTRKWWQFWK